MKVLVSGSHGLIGSALVALLKSKGHAVFRLVRREAHSAEEIRWNPVAATVDKDQLEGFDAVVHLAGDSVAERWTPAKKARIRNSRVKGTKFLAETLAELTNKPPVLVAASAIGYYGQRGDELLTEQSPVGLGFLASVCREWEAAAQPAAAAGIRVVNLRIGIVLSRKGGALAKMLPVFEIGAGGVLGSGKQYMSWIALDDVLGVIEHAIENESLSGPTNTVAPEPVTNQEFTKTLGTVLGRPTFLPVPSLAVELLMGQMAEELLLASAHVEPVKLLASGYKFAYPNLEGALRHVLERQLARR